MSRKLVAYFSVSGTTAQVAEKLAEAIGADIFAIEPEVPYTQADLNWMDKKARSTVEMNDPNSRPTIAAKRDNMAEYDVIFVGFPIWRKEDNALCGTSEGNLPDSGKGTWLSCLHIDKSPLDAHERIELALLQIK